MSVYEESSLENIRRVEDFMLKQMKVDRVVFQNELIEEFKRAIPHGGRFDSFSHKLKVWCNAGFTPGTYFIRLEFNFLFVVDNASPRVMTVHCSFTPDHIKASNNVREMVKSEFVNYFHCAGRDLGLTETQPLQGIR